MAGVNDVEAAVALDDFLVGGAGRGAAGEELVVGQHFDAAEDCPGRDGGRGNREDGERWGRARGTIADEVEWRPGGTHRRWVSAC